MEAVRDAGASFDQLEYAPASASGRRRLAGEDLGNDRHVDIAARQDEADALAGMAIPFLEQRRERRRARALREIVRRRVVDADRLRDLVLADANDAGRDTRPHRRTCAPRWSAPAVPPRTTTRRPGHFLRPRRRCRSAGRAGRAP